jgi:hypothetical protein
MWKIEMETTYHPSHCLIEDRGQQTAVNDPVVTTYTPPNVEVALHFLFIFAYKSDWGRNHSSGALQNARC